MVISVGMFLRQNNKKYNFKIREKKMFSSIYNIQMAHSIATRKVQKKKFQFTKKKHSTILLRPRRILMMFEKTFDCVAKIARFFKKQNKQEVTLKFQNVLRTIASIRDLFTVLFSYFNFNKWSLSYSPWSRGR